MSSPAAGLLTIDVGEELRKLAGGGLAGAWELPTELARWACARGAARVELGLDRRRLRLAVSDAALAPETPARLAALLDESAPAPRRHAALLALEAGPDAAWIGLLALSARSARLESGGRWLAWGRQRAVVLGDGGASGLRLDIGTGADLSSAGDWLRVAARFAASEIRLDGRPLERGFAGAWAEAPLPPPLSGRVALLRGGRSARVLLTVDGILASHVTLPEAPPFEAVVAADGWAAAQGAREALRAGLRPHLPLVVTAAVDLMLAQARALPPGPGPEGADLRSALLQAARRRLRLGAVLPAPLLDLWQAGRWSRASLLQAGQLAQAQGGVLEAVGPGDDPADSLPRGPLLALDAEERARLAELLGVRFVQPPRRTRSRPASWRERARAAWGRLARAVSRATAGPALPAASLGDGERALVAALAEGLRALAPAARLELRPCRGGGRPFLRPGELWLPLDQALLRHAAAARSAPPLALAASVLARAGWRPR